MTASETLFADRHVHPPTVVETNVLGRSGNGSWIELLLRALSCSGVVAESTKGAYKPKMSVRDRYHGGKSFMFVKDLANSCIVVLDSRRKNLREKFCLLPEEAASDTSPHAAFSLCPGIFLDSHTKDNVSKRFKIFRMNSLVEPVAQGIKLRC
ncbi:hypothetical protein SISNIDRAFT_471573 [Sistotremastrum niveocremeum HHB9708]|uniref:Uncharacterized protein n=1 Tax=Sistotremastrum niveocremeum HHB9708 TaxID=1314777 RepID=A0A164MGL9_9AGAM|nr:hypothetical protein SISNIDRAFT_471573 [Sistotremastrum niveocremeum HHB9708]